MAVEAEGKKITLRLPNALYQGLQAEAERRGMSMNGLINIFIHRFLLEV